MFGLILKDFMLIKSNFKMLIILLVFFGLMTFMGNDSLLFVPTVMSFAIIISTFSFDEYYHTNAYITTMPNGRKNMVLAKYCVAIMLSLGLMLTCSVLGVIIGTINDTLDFEYLMVTGFSTFLSTLFLYSIIFPITYKFGIEKSRMALLVIVFAGAGLVMLFGNIISIPADSIAKFIQVIESYGIIVFPLIIIIALLLSFSCSYSIVKSREY